MRGIGPERVPVIAHPMTPPSPYVPGDTPGSDRIGRILDGRAKPSDQAGWPISAILDRGTEAVARLGWTRTSGPAGGSIARCPVMTR